MVYSPPPCQDSSSGPVRVVDGALVIDEVAPSDGGTYSCMAVSTSGNASRDVAIHSKRSRDLEATQILNW